MCTLCSMCFNVFHSVCVCKKVCNKYSTIIKQKDTQMTRMNIITHAKKNPWVVIFIPFLFHVIPYVNLLNFSFWFAHLHSKHRNVTIKRNNYLKSSNLSCVFVMSQGCAFCLMHLNIFKDVCNKYSEVI